MAVWTRIVGNKERFWAGSRIPKFSLVFCSIRISRSYLAGTPRKFRWDPYVGSKEAFQFNIRLITEACFRKTLKRGGLIALFSRSLTEWSIEMARLVIDVTFRAALYTITERLRYRRLRPFHPAFHVSSLLVSNFDLNHIWFSRSVASTNSRGLSNYA